MLLNTEQGRFDPSTTVYSYFFSKVSIKHNFCNTMCFFLSQVSVVGAVRGFSSFFTSVLYSVDDMTAPPLPVKQWLSSEDMKQMSVTPTGAYVKVVGSLRQSFQCHTGKIMLVAMHIRCVKDLNEITSHMMEVVQAQMYLSGKVLMDVVTVNIITRFWQEEAEHQESAVNNNMSHVLSMLRQARNCPRIKTAMVKDLITIEADCLTCWKEKALTFLLSEGHVFSTIDENHFKC
uniref:Replication protein A C-terminal domain-containing protein n=1 Tax=Gouania willdenowi TaxID=441366 RepID=A0A8C5EA88_GOUWI